MSSSVQPFKVLWLLALSVGLGACTVLPESPPQDVYRLPPSALSPAPGDVADVSLRVARPSASDMLSSTRIAVVPEGNRFSVYQDARWSSPVPTLWRNHLLDAFHKDGRIERLSSARENLRADVELGGILQAFQTEYAGGTPEVVIRFDAHLVDAGSKRILASRRFAVTEQVAGSQVPEVVEAFGRASDNLSRELIDWTLSHVQ